MSKNYYIMLNGNRITVTKEIYYAYMRPKWMESKRLKARLQKEFSLEFMAEQGFDGMAAMDAMLIEDSVLNKLLVEQLLFAVGSLTDGERRLIEGLYFHGESERAYAKKIGLAPSTVNKRKKFILEKLKQILEI